MKYILVIASFMGYYVFSGNANHFKSENAASSSVEKVQYNQVDVEPRAEFVQFEQISEEITTKDIEQEEDDQSSYQSDNNPVTYDEDPTNYPEESPDTYINVNEEEVQSPTHYKNIPPGACAIC